MYLNNIINNKDIFKFEKIRSKLVQTETLKQAGPRKRDDKTSQKRNMVTA